MSDEGSTSSSDDENPPEIGEEFEKSFFKTLSSLKNKDPSIYDQNTKFFDDSAAVIPSKVKKKEAKEKPLFLKDYEQKCLTENKGYEDEDREVTGDVYPDSVPYSVEQRQLKESFKSFLKDSDDEENEGLLKPSLKSEQDKEKEEAEYIQWLKGQKQELEDKSTEDNLKKLRDYWNSDDLGQDEAFLRDYILNKRFLDNDESENDEDDNLTEDSETLEAQEQYEQEYNLRYENQEDGLLRRFPRNVENSLRRKDNKRSKKRVEVKERKETEKQKKRDEINRQKKIKCKEISERLEKLKELTGNENLAFNDDDILNDFDPEEHDKKMSQMYNDEFYNVGDDEKPRIDDLGLNDIQDEANFNEGEDVDQYIELPISEQERPSRKNKKKTRTERKKERKKKAFTDISAVEKPIYDPKLHESYQKYMDEYYQLDCEDFIDDIPCRFKYKQVQANDYGLSIEEILSADDKELNRWSSIKKIYKIRSGHVEKNEAKIYKLKGQDEMLKKKILPSLYKTEEEEEELQNNHDNEENTKKKKKSKKKNKQSTPIENNQNHSGETSNTTTQEENTTVIADNYENNAAVSNTNNIKKKNKKRKRVSGESIAIDESENQISFSDEAEKKSEPNIAKPSLGDNSVQNGNHSTFYSHKSLDNKNHFKNKFKKHSKGGKFKKNHDFHDSRLSAYGLNPKKFRVK